MKEYIHNYNNLNESDIDDTSIRTKALLIHNENIILGYADSVYQFPGGHLEEGETLNECLKREVMEEVGIIIKDEQINPPFYKVIHMNKDWPTIGNNRKSEIYYFIINTKETPNLKQTNYTEDELKYNFTFQEIPLNKVISVLEENIEKHNKNKVITPDMIRVIEEYLKERKI